MKKADYIKRVKNFKFKKALGQNFLVDNIVIDKIANFVKGCDEVLEIGAGAGFVSEKILENNVNKFYAVEIDKNVIPILNKNCLSVIEKSQSQPFFKIINEDILNVDLSKITDKKLKIVANIPYYIASPILAHLLGEIDDVENKNRNSIDEIILMVQLEVAKRLIADNNTKNIKEYGLLSVLAQFWADVDIICKVPNTSFYPSPKVDSALVRLKINNNPKTDINPYLRRVIKGAFSMRRKTFKNCMQNIGYNVEDILLSLGYNPNIRGEKLSVYDFSKISKELYERNKNKSTL